MESELLAIAGLPGLELRGFHVYSGTQCLVPASVAGNYGIMADLFRRASEFLDLEPDLLVFGSGIGIPYTEDDEELDLAALADAALPLLDSVRTDRRLGSARRLLEIGRWLVGPAGVYLTRVLRVKRSRGVDIAVLDGGLHHHLAATGNLGSVIHRNYPMEKVPGASVDVEPRPYDLAGPLCTSIDTLGHDVLFPGLEPGDLVAIRSSGAYGPTASPSGFISHPPAVEVLVEGDSFRL
jgi:diaminopimelate decarboxylase